MSVWLCIPSARPPEQAAAVLRKWRERGYKIAVWLDAATSDQLPHDHATTGIGPYPGYAVATNGLIARVFELDPAADWFVIGGDDVEPDANHTAEEIARECSAFFGVRNVRLQGGIGYLNADGTVNPACISTFGVMQPTGDRWGDSARSRARHGEDNGAYIDRVCGSAWLGREFCRRVNLGNGPLWPEYPHMFVDEELQCVAKKLGVLWQRRDLIQLHQHWGRKENPTKDDMPEFLKSAYSEQHWEQYGSLFRKRQAAGFPGSELQPQHGEHTKINL